MNQAQTFRSVVYFVGAALLLLIGGGILLLALDKSVPDWVQEFLARQDIPEALTAFRNYINSGGTWRRPD